jgi:hypothetical protein
MELSRSHPAERYQDMDAEYDTDWHDVSDSQYDTYADETHSIVSAPARLAGSSLTSQYCVH